HHRDGHLLRISGDALSSNAVIAGENDNGHALCTRAFGVLQSRKLNCERLQATKRAGRLGQLALTRFSGVAMCGRNCRTLLPDPLGKDGVLTSGRYAFENIAIHDPAMPYPRLRTRFRDLSRDFGKRSRERQLVRHAEISTPPDMKSRRLQGLEGRAAIEHYY